MLPDIPDHDVKIARVMVVKDSGARVLCVLESDLMSYCKSGEKARRMTAYLVIHNYIDVNGDVHTPFCILL